MSHPEDRVFLLHASDGLEWAHFIATKLAAPSYGITSKISQFTSYDDPPETIRQPEDNGGENIYYNYNDETLMENCISDSQEKPELPEKRASRVNDKDNVNSFSEEINNSRACVVLVSPNIVESELPLEIDVHSLKTGRTVFIFLGVELEEARSYFRTDFDAIMKCKCGFVYSTEQQTINDALIQIIEAFEDTGESEQSEENDEIYNVPTNSMQLNRIEKVFPTHLTESDREVYILLSWPPEDSLQLLLEMEDSTERKGDLTMLSDRMYTFILPGDITSSFHFHLECQGHKFGRTKIKLPSKLERLRAILDSELDPVALLSSALNLSTKDVGDLDVCLAHKLQQLCPSTKFQNLFPIEDDFKQSQPDRPSSVRWPTLLHFAAELNLRTFCTELLRYPGMVIAACTENSDGEFPSQIASRKRFSDLESDLLQFVEKERVKTESESNEHRPPLPPPRSPSTVCTKPQNDDMYCDMSVSSKGSVLDLHQRTGSETLSSSRSVSPKDKRDKFRMFSSHSFSQVDATARPKLAELRQSTSQDENLYITMEGNSSPINEGSQRCDSPDGTLRPDDASPTRSSNESPTSQKALKCLGVSEKDIQRSSMVENPELEKSPHHLSATCPPGQRILRQSTFYVDEERMSLSSNYEEEFELIRAQNLAIKNKQSMKKEKIKSFFSKITGSKRSTNDVYSIGKKIEKSSKSRRGSESSNKSTLPFDLERDSGSYSDEENEEKTHKSRSGSKGKIFKESSKPMKRRMSKRVEIAKTETINDYPNLPSAGERNRSSYYEK